MKKEFESGKVRVVITPGRPPVDPSVTLVISAPLSDWKNVVKDLGATKGKSSYGFYDALDDAVQAADNK